MRKFIFVLAATALLAMAGVASANTIASSTMYFRGNLTDEGGGVYSGIVNMVDEVALGIGDGVSGYDIYAKNGATAHFGDDVGGTCVDNPVLIANHDAWPSWTPDTPDWYQYSLHLYKDDEDVYRWALRNHAGATLENPHSTIARGVPMSGTMCWANGCALETDVGAYLPGTGTGECPGWAAANGGGACTWDMDWSWGSEVVPLECCGFQVSVSDLGGGQYEVVMTPCCIPEPGALGLVGLGLVGLVRRKRRS